MQWSPNGKLLATGSKDCTVIVWNFDPVALKLSHYKVPVLPYRTLLFSFHHRYRSLCEKYLPVDL
jgi:WD40 repeat protein